MSEDPYRPWTMWELQELRRMLAAGVSYHAVGRHLNRSKDSTRSRALKLGLVSAEKNHKFARKPWTDKDEAEITRMRKLGYSWPMVGKALKRTAAACIERANRRGLNAQRHRPLYQKPECEVVKTMRKCLGPICRGKVLFASRGVENRVCERCRGAMNGICDVAV